jgi:hypothetical protein
VTRLKTFPALLLALSVSCWSEAVQAQPPTPNVPNPACLPPPALAASEDFGDGREAFGRDEDAFRQVRDRFDMAYRRTCYRGVMRDRPLIPPDSGHPGQLFLKNAPEANVASIYRDNEGAAAGEMVLEFHFVTSEGMIELPSVEELEEAIDCSVRGATEQEQADTGRCLAD